MSKQVPPYPKGSAFLAKELKEFLGGREELLKEITGLDIYIEDWFSTEFTLSVKPEVGIRRRFTVKIIEPW